MITPNENISKEVLRQYEQEAYKRFRTQFAKTVEQILVQYNMTWDDLATLILGHPNGDAVKCMIWKMPISAVSMNEYAHVLGCELHIVFKPRS